MTDPPNCESPAVAQLLPLELREDDDVRYCRLIYLIFLSVTRPLFSLFAPVKFFLCPLPLFAGIPPTFSFAAISGSFFCSFLCSVRFQLSFGAFAFPMS